MRVLLPTHHLTRVLLPTHHPTASPQLATLQRWRSIAFCGWEPHRADVATAAIGVRIGMPEHGVWRARQARGAGSRPMTSEAP